LPIFTIYKIDNTIIQGEGGVAPPLLFPSLPLDIRWRRARGVFGRRPRGRRPEKRVASVAMGRHGGDGSGVGDESGQRIQRLERATMTAVAAAVSQICFEFYFVNVHLKNSTELWLVGGRLWLSYLAICINSRHRLLFEKYPRRKNAT
jgi:hypothetical protein